MGAYYGVKTAARPEHVIYDYEQKAIWVTSNSLTSKGVRNVTVDLIHLNGSSISSQNASMDKAVPNGSTKIMNVKGLDKIHDVGLLKLQLKDGKGDVLSRNVYWLPKTDDVLDWDNSSWYSTPITEYADLTGLYRVGNASVSVDVSRNGKSGAQVKVQNKANIPAVFMKLGLMADHIDVESAYWTDNYVTLWPEEKLSLGVTWADEVGNGGNVSVVWSGVNVPEGTTNMK
jgi:exo-1,4-beta-D-glucosaminidase